MIERRLIFEIHRLAHDGLSNRNIATTLQLDRGTVRKYLRDPNPAKALVIKASKLDPFKDEIQKLLTIDHKASATVVQQRLKTQGFDGGLSILRAYLRTVRPQPKEAFIRFESPPGQQCQVDWGHFGTLTYDNITRKLYCLAVIECYSRLMYLEFTHSQRQEALHRGLLNAFRFFDGSPKELVTDNMLTAVIERDGPLVRFNEAFLDFLRPFHVVPVACNVGQAHEKGKIEKGAIHYIRHNFRPLRSFLDLDDVQAQANGWCHTVANVRVHSTTGERPRDRFKPEPMTPLPELLPDCRDTAAAKVHSDFSIHVDGNTYTVPPWLVGKTVIAKADHQTLTVYFKDKAVATHKPSWHRKQRIESRFTTRRRPANKGTSSGSQKMSPSSSVWGKRPKSMSSNWQPPTSLSKRMSPGLLALKEDYGSHALLGAIRRALAHRAYGADYIENILYQETTPIRVHPPVKLQNREALNRIRLQEPSLADYDTVVVKRRNHLD